MSFAQILRLNLGGGDVPIPGYITIDRKNGQEVYPLPYPDDSVEAIRASHILEHFGHRESLDVLREWVRVLRPGGTLKIAVPDFEQAARLYLDRADGVPVQGYVMGGQIDADDFHRSIWDEDGLSAVMEHVGLMNVQRWQSDVEDCAALPISLNLQGEKPLDPRLNFDVLKSRIGRDVAAVMTLPRLCPTDTLFCAMNAFRPLGITLTRFGGVFWGQGITKLFEKQTSEGNPKYLLTVDYDSLFDEDDVLALYELMERRSDIDAACPVQMKRDSDSPLFLLRDRAGEVQRAFQMSDLKAESLPVTTGHFGLTLIRVEALKRLPKPWFHSVPDPDGSWGDARIDEDVAFWHKWQAAGNTLHLANRVVLGHAQWVATWPGKTMRAVHQYLSDYNADGKPEGIWK